jgi:hypothetical protein
MTAKTFAFTDGKLVVAIAALAFATIPARAAIPRQGNNSSASAQSGQSATESIADAARRSREQAKNATKPSKVISNDDLDKSNVKPGAQGLTVDAPAKLETQPPTPEAVAEAQTSSPSPSSDAAATPATTDDPEIAQMKEQLADAENDVDLLRRDMALQQDTVLSNPDQQHDRTGHAKLTDMQQQIDAKQQEVERLKGQLAALVEQKKQPAAPKAVSKPAPPPAPVPPATPPANPPAQPQAPAPRPNPDKF